MVSNYALYEKFLKQNYPLFYSKIITKLDPKEASYFKETITTIYKILFHMQIASKQSNSYFLSEAQQLTFRLLIIIPTNDSYSINLIYRSLSEALIRFIISESHNLKLQKEIIENLSFTQLKSQINKDSYLFKNKERFLFLFSLFASSSNKIHNPGKSINFVEHLDDIFYQKTSFKNLKKVVFNLNIIFYTFILPDLVKIKSNSFSLPEIIYLNNNLSNSEKIIYQRLS